MSPPTRLGRCRRAARLVLAGLAAWLAAGTAPAQSGPTPPPQQDSQSPGGVSYKSGAFSHQEHDLDIGGGGFPKGLGLERSYISNLDAGFAGGFSQGWTHNLVATVTNKMVPNPLIQPPPGRERWIYTVSIGGRSIGFFGGSTNPTGGFVGTYQVAGMGGQSLVFTGDEQTGHFTFTDSDGSVLTFGSRAENVMVKDWTAPDGTRLDLSYDANGLRSVFSNRGYAILFDYSGGRVARACAVNLALTYVAPFAACPAGATATTYSYAPGPAGGPAAQLLAGATDPTGRTTSYSYVGWNHLGCVRLPGQGACHIASSYNVCHRDGTLDEDPPNMRDNDQVVAQTTATGQTYAYSFPASPICPDPSPYGKDATMTTVSGASTFVHTNAGGVPTTITDPLGRTTALTYIGSLNGGAFLPLSITYPEGNRIEYRYDSRGNLSERRAKPKPPAAGETAPPDIVATASYPASCANPKTCNKPDYAVDANGQRTDFAYDPVHGGLLTETGPAVNGVRPQKRYAYAQRRAWLRTASGGYVQAGPVWLLVREAFCKTGAATATGCAIAGDEIVTAYDYGPDSGPNILLLRGVTVTADGQILRTCYGYDAQGRKISETGPRAGLASCP